MPTISQLQYILAVNHSGHFGQAAKRCHVAQPTLSAQIQKAEYELQATIFDRQKKPVELTGKGKELIEYAQDVVSAHENLMRRAKSALGEVSGRLRLGVIPTLAPYVLPWFLAKFASQYPKVELSLHERPTDEIIEELLQQRLDAAVLATPLGESLIAEQALFHDPFSLYAQTKEDVLKKGEIDVRRLDKRKLWLLEDGHCFRAQVINFCKLKAFRSPLGTVSFAAGSFETLRHLIDASKGYSLIPETYARTLPASIRRRCVRPFSGRAPSREISLVYKKNSWKTDLFEVLKQTILQHVPAELRQSAEASMILPIRVS